MRCLPRTTERARWDHRPAPRPEPVGSDQQSEMFEHSCKKAGADGCNWKIRANTEEELKAKVVAHAQSKHGVKNMTDTIYNYLRETARR